MAYYKCGRIYTTQNSNVVVDTASGAVANFQTPLAIPLPKIQFNFKATQEAGTPTPDSPIPITGVSEVNIIHSGKNLCKVSELAQGAYWGTSFTSLVTALNKLPVGTYTLSNIFRVYTAPSGYSVKHGPIKIKASVNGSTVNVNTVSQSLDQRATKGKVYNEKTTFEITESIKGNITEALLYCDNANSHSGSSGVRGKYTVSDIMVEAGSTKTAYSSTSGRYNTYIINLGGTYYGGYVSQDKDGKRELVVTHNMIDLGSLNWEKINTSSLDVGYNFRSEKIFDSKIGSVDKLCIAYPVADVVGFSNIIAKYGASVNKIGYVAPNNNFYVIDGSYSDADTFKNAMTGVKLVYELAEPFTIALPDGEPIKSFAGINNIYADTGDTSLQFRKIG